MENDSASRRLSAILSADAEGYSRLMSQDEAATVRAITECRALMAEHIGRHHGRVVDSPGDNLLAEFPSALDAASPPALPDKPSIAVLPFTNMSGDRARSEPRPGLLAHGAVAVLRLDLAVERRSE